MALSEKLQNIIQKYVDKRIAEAPRPETDAEKEYFGLTSWQDPSEYNLYDPEGNKIDFDSL